MSQTGETEEQRHLREEAESKQFWEETKRRDAAVATAKEKRLKNIQGILVLLIILAMIGGSVALGITLIKKRK